MQSRILFVAVISLATAVASADIRDLVPLGVLKQIAEEVSGEAAKRNLDTITLQHRMRASSQFDAATAHILAQLEHYGLQEVKRLTYPADGKTMFGTQKSRPVWDVRSAELWEMREIDGDLIRVRRLGDWNSVPLSLAQDSLSGDVITTLVDIGAGTTDADYAGKDIEGKLVLTSSQPGSVVEKAVGELGAAAGRSAERALLPLRPFGRRPVPITRGRFRVASGRRPHRYCQSVEPRDAVARRIGTLWPGEGIRR